MQDNLASQRLPRAACGPSTSRRLDDRRKAHERWSWLEERVSDFRLAVFCTGLVLGFFIYRMHWPSAYWLALPLTVFVGLVLVHEPTPPAEPSSRPGDGVLCQGAGAAG